MHFAGFSAGSYTAIAQKLTTESCVSTSNSPSAQTQLQWEPLAVQYSIWLRSSPLPSSPTPPACSLLTGHCVYHMSGKTVSVFGGLDWCPSVPVCTHSGARHPFGFAHPSS